MVCYHRIVCAALFYAWHIYLMQPVQVSQDDCRVWVVYSASFSLCGFPIEIIKVDRVLGISEVNVVMVTIPSNKDVFLYSKQGVVVNLDISLCISVVVCQCRHNTPPN